MIGQVLIDDTAGGTRVDIYLGATAGNLNLLVRDTGDSSRFREIKLSWRRQKGEKNVWLGNGILDAWTGILHPPDADLAAIASAQRTPTL